MDVTAPDSPPIGAAPRPAPSAGVPTAAARPWWRATWQAVLAAARFIGRIQAWLLLTIAYFVVILPVALIYRCVSDPLRLRPASGSPWQTKAAPRDLQRWGRSQS